MSAGGGGGGSSGSSIDSSRPKVTVRFEFPAVDHREKLIYTLEQAGEIKNDITLWLLQARKIEMISDAEYKKLEKAFSTAMVNIITSISDYTKIEREALTLYTKGMQLKAQLVMIEAIIKDLIYASETKVDAKRLSRFFGNKEDAMKAAMLDDKQFVVNKIVNVIGDVTKRSYCDVVIKFEDGEVHKLNLVASKVMDTVQFEDFCRTNKHFLPLLHKVKDAKRAEEEVLALLQKQPYKAKVNDVFYTNLMSWTVWDTKKKSDWYTELGLDNEIMYMMPGKVVAILAGNNFEIEFPYMHGGARFVRKASYMHCEAQKTLHEGQVAITPKFLLDHPQIFDAKTRQAEVTRIKAIIARAKDLRA